MNTYYVPSQDPALDRSNTSLQICPPPALCHVLPAGSSLDPVPVPIYRTQALLTRTCGWLKVLLHFREQLPQVAKSQETPSSKNGLDKGVYLDLETARFLW